MENLFEFFNTRNQRLLSTEILMSAKRNRNVFQIVQLLLSGVTLPISFKFQRFLLFKARAIGSSFHSLGITCFQAFLNVSSSLNSEIVCV